MFKHDALKPAQHCLEFSLTSEEQAYHQWLLTRPNKFLHFKEHPTDEEKETIKAERLLFDKQCALFEDVDRIFVKVDLEKSYDAWLASIGVNRDIVGKHHDDLMHRFKTTCTTMKDDTKHIERDRAAKQACEKYQVEPKELFFEEYLLQHENIWVQVNAKSLHPMKTQLKLEFGKWCSCPWKVESNKEFLQYLLKCPKGPSGFDNLDMAKKAMKLFYFNTPEAWQAISSRDFNTITTFSESLPDNDYSVTTMLRDLEEYVPTESDSVSAVPSAVPSGAQTPDYPAEMPPGQMSSPVVPTDLESQLKKLQDQQEALKKQIALQNANQINSKLKVIFVDLAKKVKSKRSFQRMADWRKALKELPPTKKAKKFKEAILSKIKAAQSAEKLAIEARSVARKGLVDDVTEHFSEVTESSSSSNF